MLEFQQNEPKNHQKIVTPMNNKVAAISKMMELPGDKYLVLESKFFDFAETMVNLKSWPIVIFALNSLIHWQNLKHLTEKETYENPVSSHYLTQMLHCLASKHTAVTSQRPLNSVDVTFDASQQNLYLAEFAFVSVNSILSPLLLFYEGVYV